MIRSLALMPLLFGLLIGIWVVLAAGACDAPAAGLADDSTADCCLQGGPGGSGALAGCCTSCATGMAQIDPSPLLSSVSDTGPQRCVVMRDGLIVMPDVPPPRTGRVRLT